MRFGLLLLVVAMICANTPASEEKGSVAKKVPTPAQLANGKKLFEVNCSACHGPTGMGDGAAAAALVPKPRNLNDVQYMSKRPEAVLRQIITEGGQSAGLSPVMIGWKAALKPEQIDAVLQFVLTMSQPKLASKAKQ